MKKVSRMNKHNVHTAFSASEKLADYGEIFHILMTFSGLICYNYLDIKNYLMRRRKNVF